MLKYHDNHLYKIVLLTSACLVFFVMHTYAADEVRENTSNDYDQITQQSTSTSSENQATPSGSGRKRRLNSVNRLHYLSLSESRSKINLIKQIEKELKNNYRDSAAYPRQTGHHWNLSELSDYEALNLCYTLWLGLTFSDIDEIDKTNLPSQLYAYCRESKKVPIGDIGYSGKSKFCYNIVYPYTEKQFKSKAHRISVLKCVCTFTRKPRKVHTFNDSNRCFFAHKFNENKYLILSSVSKERYRHHALKIIDVQDVDPTTILAGDKRSIPISTNQQLGNTIDECDQSVDETTSTGNENQANDSGSKGIGRHPWEFRADRPKYLSLTVSRNKIDLIIQKENEMKSICDYLDEFSSLPSHIWDVSELSEKEAENVCYSLWLGFTFSEIDAIDKAYLPPKLYPYCKYKTYPVRDYRGFGLSRLPHKIVYPLTEKELNTKHQISGLLQCICRYTHVPNTRIVSNDSNRKFYAHKLQHNEYLILSPESGAYHQRNLAIIDVQEIDPDSHNFVDKRSVPVSIN